MTITKSTETNESNEYKQTQLNSPVYLTCEKNEDLKPPDRSEGSELLSRLAQLARAVAYPYRFKNRPAAGHVQRGWQRGRSSVHAPSAGF